MGFMFLKYQFAFFLLTYFRWKENKMLANYVLFLGMLNYT